MSGVPMFEHFLLNATDERHGFPSNFYIIPGVSVVPHGSHGTSASSALARTSLAARSRISPAAPSSMYIRSIPLWISLKKAPWQMVTVETVTGCHRLWPSTVICSYRLLKLQKAMEIDNRIGNS